MRSLSRVLATSATALALSFAGLAVAGPAAADPSNGEGCAGLPELPAAYVCVVSVTPTGALPGLTSSSIPVRVPPVCYVAGCTTATTVEVPVPGTTPGSGTVAVLWYGGAYYPIGVGIGGEVLPLVGGVVDLAVGAAGTVLGIAGGAAGDVQAIVDGLPTAGDLVDAVVRIVDREVGPTVDTVTWRVERLLETGIYEVILNVYEVVQRELSEIPPMCIC